MMNHFAYLNRENRFPYFIETSEIDRRQKATLAEMEAHGIDCLVLQSNTDWLGGALKYLTDLSTVSYAYYGLFSKAGIELFGHGVSGTKVGFGFNNVYNNNVIDGYSRPYIASMTPMDNIHPEDMANCIKKHGYKKIGWVGMGSITANVYKYLTENLPGCEFVNASEILDHLRAVKSRYELELFQNAVNIHDRIIAAVPAILRPGRTEREVVTELTTMAHEIGCPVINIMIGSHPTQPGLSPYPVTNKVIDKNDTVRLLVELCCPYYIWGEVGRMYRFTEASEEFRKCHEYSMYLQDYIAELSVPGASPAEIFAKLNEKLISGGFAPEGRIPVHSQSCDIVDRPTWTEYETMPLEENMIFASHLGCKNDTHIGWCCDNYVIKRDGAVRLNKTPRGIVIID